MSGIPDAAAWRQAGRALLAKAISEFAYEEAVLPAVALKPDGRFTACLRLASGVRYRFAGARRIWGNLAIDPDSLRRLDGALETEAADPQQWVLDARAELGGDAAATAGFLRELGRARKAEALRLARCRGLDGAAWLALPPDQAQALLSGHPKAVANKGRLGWSDAALAAFAPERAEPFQLAWVMLDARHATWAAVGGADFPGECIPGEERGDFDAAVARSGIAPAHALPVPVHPWQ